MISMQLSAKESKQEASLDDDDDKGPKYPWGLSISLDDVSLEKLGMTDVPAMGTKFKLMAEVEVTSVSQYETQGSSDKNVNLQITSMELSTPDGDRKNPEDVLYAK